MFVPFFCFYNFSPNPKISPIPFNNYYWKLLF